MVKGMMSGLCQASGCTDGLDQHHLGPPSTPLIPGALFNPSLRPLILVWAMFGGWDQDWGQDAWSLSQTWSCLDMVPLDPGLNQWVGVLAWLQSCLVTMDLPDDHWTWS